MNFLTAGENKGELYYEQKKRIYIGGASGGNRHHRVVDVDIDARPGKGKKTGQSGRMYVKPESMGQNFCTLYE